MQSLFKWNTRALVGVFLAVGVVCAQGVAHAGEIERDMKSMKSSLRSAKDSSSLEELAQQVAAMKYSAWHASNLTLRGSDEEQRIYREGLNLLHRQLTDIEQLIKQQDFEGAKRALQQLRQTENTYHDKLGV